MRSTIAIGLFAAAAAACTAPETERAGAPAAESSRRPLVAHTGSPVMRPDFAGRPAAILSEDVLAALSPSAERRARLARPRASARTVPSNAEKLTRPVGGARFATDRGQRLLDVLADLPPERAQYGATAQTFGGEGFCAQHRRTAGDLYGDHADLPLRERSEHADPPRAGDELAPRILFRSARSPVIVSDPKVRIFFRVMIAS